MKNSRIILSLVAVLLSTAAWGVTETTIYPTWEGNYRTNDATPTGWTKVTTTDAQFEVYNSSRFFAIQTWIIPNIDNVTSLKFVYQRVSGQTNNGQMCLWSFPYTNMVTSATPFDKSAGSFLDNVKTVLGVYPGNTIDSEHQPLVKSTSRDADSKHYQEILVSSTALTSLKGAFTKENDYLKVNILLNTTDAANNYKYYHTGNEACYCVVTYDSDVTLPVVVNSNQTKGYADFATAVFDATTGQELILYGNAPCGESRIEIDNKNVTIRGGRAAQQLQCGVGNSTIMFLVKGSSEVTFKNLTIYGNSGSRSLQAIESAGSAKVYIEDVTFTNFTYNDGVGDVKNAASLYIKGNNSFVKGIALNKNKQVNDNGTSHTSPINLILAFDYAEWDVVLGSTDASKYNPVASDGHSTWELSTHNSNLRASRTALNLSDGDANNTKIIESSDGKTLDVTLNRPIPSTSFSTFCLPFDVSAEDAATKFNDPELLEYKETIINGDEATFHFVDAEDGIKAGVPYLIKPSSDITENITFNGVTIDNTERPVSDGNFQFVPLFSKTTTLNSENATHKYIYLGASDQLYWAAQNTTIKGFRAYLEDVRPGGSSSAPIRRFSIGRHNTPTGIENVSAKYGESQKILRDGQVLIIRDGVEYNLMGQKVK